MIKYLASVSLQPITNPFIEKEEPLNDNGCDIFSVPAFVFNVDAT